MPRAPPNNSSSNWAALPPPPPDPGQGYFYATQGAFAGWIGITSTALFLCVLCCCAYLMRWVRRPTRLQAGEAGQQLALTELRSMVLGQPCSALASNELPALYRALTSSSASWGEPADGTVTGQPAQAAVGLPVMPPTQSTFRNPLFTSPRPLFGGALVLEAPPVLPVMGRSAPLGFGVAHQGSGFDSLGPRQQ